MTLDQGKKMTKETIKYQVTFQLPPYNARSLGLFNTYQKAHAVLRKARKESPSGYGHVTKTIIDPNYYRYQGD